MEEEGHLLRAELWSKELKRILLEELETFRLWESQGMVYGENKSITTVMTVKEAVVLGTVAVLIKNPEVTRRGLFTIFRSET